MEDVSVCLGGASVSVPEVLDCTGCATVRIPAWRTVARKRDPAAVHPVGESLGNGVGPEQTGLRMQPRRIGDVEDKGKFDGMRRPELAVDRGGAETEPVDVGAAR